MSVTGKEANRSVPAYEPSVYDFASASGLQAINPGDWLVFSGNWITSSHTGLAWNRASAAGFAVDRNPGYDENGNQINNPAVIFGREGRFRVSAHFSGQPLAGVHVFPATTGSGVNAPSGVTGVGALWQTALPVSISGNPTGAPARGVAQMVQWYAAGNGGTGEMDIWFSWKLPDYI